MNAKSIVKNIIRNVLYFIVMLIIMEVVRRLMGASDSLAITWQEALVGLIIVIVGSVIQQYIKDKKAMKAKKTSANP